MSRDIVLAMVRKRTEPGEKRLPLEQERAAAKFVGDYRDAVDLDQKELGKAVGVSQFVISKLETEGGVGAAVLVKLADYTGVLIDRIIGRSGVEIDVALDYLAIEHAARREIREAALALKGSRPTSAREWADWIEKRLELERVDLRLSEIAETSIARKVR